MGRRGLRKGKYDGGFVFKGNWGIIFRKREGQKGFKEFKGGSEGGPGLVGPRVEEEGVAAEGEVLGGSGEGEGLEGAALGGAASGFSFRLAAILFFFTISHCSAD